MLRQLQTLCRVPSRSLTSSLASSLIRSPKPQKHLSWQRQFFSQHRISCRGPRNDRYWRGGSQSQKLRANIHCTLYVSIGALVFMDELNWAERRTVGIDTVQHITGEEDSEEMRRKFYELGPMILQAFTNADVQETVYVYDPRDPPSFDCKIYSSADPDVEGGTLVLYLVALNSNADDTHVLEYGNRVTDIASGLIPHCENLAKTLSESSRVRGAMVLLEEDGSWKSMYWDGKRWLNVVFLEWQTPESLAYIWE